MKTIWIQNWTESERGWGQKPDGVTIHNTKEDALNYVDIYNKKHNNKSFVPDYYIFADGKPFLALIDEQVYSEIINASNMISLNNKSLDDLVKKQKLQY